MKKSIRQKLLEKLYNEHGIAISNPMNIISSKSIRNRDVSACSWFTLTENARVLSHYPMKACVDMPTRIDLRNNEIWIEIDFDKIYPAE